VIAAAHETLGHLKQAVLETRTSADISTCGRYRYRLTRQLDPHVRSLTFVMLNPSTADAAVDDAKLHGFAS
jgi:hypothetical protein